MTDVERLLPDGVYLNLAERTYFNQGREGSTDITSYFLKKEGAWWKSPMNPHYVPESEDASSRTFGKGLHALILEGDRAYADRFYVIPTKDQLAKEHGWAKDGGRFCVTVGDMELALEKRGMFPKRMKKEELIPYVRSRAPDLIIWDDFTAQFAKQNEGKLAVTEEDDYHLRLMTRLVREHADVGPYFQYGPTHIPLTEVSVLWTDSYGARTMRRRARLDAFFPQQTVDLKAITNIGGRPLQFAAGEHLAKFGYQVQMADHHVARKWAYRMILEGRIFDGTDPELRTKESQEQFEEQKAWLSRYPTEAPNWEYVWIFYQRPNSKEGMAPIVLPWQEDYGSDLHMDGIRARLQGIQTYLRCMAQFGPDEPWTRVEPVHTTREGAPNRVFLPAYVAQEQMPGEEDEL